MGKPRFRARFGKRSALRKKIKGSVIIIVIV